MKRGSITILIIVLVAVGAAAVSVWYHYNNQRRALEFWGAPTAMLIDRAPEVAVIAVGQPAPRAARGPDDESDETPGAEGEVSSVPKAVEFNGMPWIVLDSKDASSAKGVTNLRRALVLDTTYDWTSPQPEEEPKWKYGLSVSDKRNWATVLFDFDTRQIGLSGGRQTALLDPEANKDFEEFFAEHFPAAESEDANSNDSEGKDADAPAKESSDEASDDKPADKESEPPDEPAGADAPAAKTDDEP